MEGGLAGRKGNNVVPKLQVGLDPRDRQIAVSDQTLPHAIAMRLYLVCMVEHRSFHRPSMDELASQLLKSRIPRKTIIFEHEL